MMLRGIGQPLNEYLPTGAPWTLGAHSSVLAWRIRGMGKPGGLPSLGSHRVGHDWSDFIAAADTGWSGQPATKSSPLGTHATIYSMKSVCVCVYLCLVMSDSLQPYGLRPARPFCLWDFLQPGILEWIASAPPGDLPDPESNSRLLHSRQILCCWATRETLFSELYYAFSRNQALF